MASRRSGLHCISSRECPRRGLEAPRRQYCEPNCRRTCDHPF
jgi:hypothetical protein